MSTSPSADGFKGYLSHAEIISLSDAAIVLGLPEHRDSLLSGLSPGFVATLPGMSTPVAQLASDLSRLSRVERLTDGSIPILIWMETACLFTSSRIEAEPLRACRDRIARHAHAGAFLSPDKKQILVVEDRANQRYLLVEQLRSADRDVHEAASVEESLTCLRELHIDLVLTDMRLGPDHPSGGLAVLRASMVDDPSRPVVIITAFPEVKDAVDALKMGALDYIEKPYDERELRRTVEKALLTRIRRSRTATRDSRHPPDIRLGVESRCAVMLNVRHAISRAADAPTAVLITGEGGVGKELAAREMHRRSRRAQRPFIVVNCGAIRRELIEAELFGYEKGSLPGAAHGKQGALEIAAGGTLFLDEVEELPKDMQVKLLHALKTGEITHVGGRHTIPFDVRVIAATSRDLVREASAGGFREDLLYRLNVVTLELPALRERSEDIPALAEHFRLESNLRLGKRTTGFEQAAMDRLRRYTWPGNIRELGNVIERAVLFAEGEMIQEEDLGPDMQERTSKRPFRRPESTPAPAPSSSFEEQSRANTVSFERDMIERTLVQTCGDLAKAAKLLKMSREGLRLKMKELGVKRR